MAVTDNAIEEGNLDNLIVSEQDFKDEFLTYVHRRFGPDALFPPRKTEGRMKMVKVILVNCQKHIKIVISSCPLQIRPIFR